MSFRINRCCCFNNSQDASFASGVYTTIISVISIVCLATKFRYYPVEGEGISYYHTTIFIVALVMQTIFFLVSLLLLYGIRKGNRFYIIPWMVWMIIHIVAQFASIFLAFFVVPQILRPEIVVPLLMIIAFCGLNITCFLVVKTHFQEIASDSNVAIHYPPCDKKILIST